MFARAVSAGKWLAPLAVLVPILAVPLGAIWISHDQALLAVLLLVGGLAAIAALGYFTYGLWRSLFGALLTWATMAVSLLAFFIISINTSICGKDIPAAWSWLAPTAGLIAFFAVGLWGVRAHHATWSVPLGYVIGFGVTVSLLAAVPGAPGFCET